MTWCCRKAAAGSTTKNLEAQVKKQEKQLTTLQTSEQKAKEQAAKLEASLKQLNVEHARVCAGWWLELCQGGLMGWHITR
jgi:hypothetical protein